MDQDIAALAKEQPIQSMIQNIENEVGRRPVTEQELQDQRKNSPCMVMAYVLARLVKAQDWFGGWRPFFRHMTRHNRTTRLSSF